MTVQEKALIEIEGVLVQRAKVRYSVTHFVSDAGHKWLY